jgi:pilus assembly protein Flp/PilA
MTQLRKLFGAYLMVVPASLVAPSIEREEGQTLAEYALILALIAVVVVVVVATLGGTIQSLFSNVSSSI